MCTTFIPMQCIYKQECFLHSLIQLLYPWVQYIYIHVRTFFTFTDTTSIPMDVMYLHARMFSTLAHDRISLLFPWVQCIYTCKTVFYNRWYHFYSHGCDVFSDAKQKKHVFLNTKPFFFKHSKKKQFFIIIYNLKAGNYFFILWTAYSCYIQVVKHYIWLI